MAASKGSTIGLAAADLWEHIVGDGDDLNEDEEERIADVMIALARHYHQDGDTRRTLVKRLRALFPPQAPDHAPWEEPEGEGWKVLMDYMRRGPSSTSPEASADSAEKPA